jgi:hypothetical protein
LIPLRTGEDNKDIKMSQMNVYKELMKDRWDVNKLLMNKGDNAFMKDSQVEPELLGNRD